MFKGEILTVYGDSYDNFKAVAYGEKEYYQERISGTSHGIFVDRASFGILQLQNYYAKESFTPLYFGKEPVKVVYRRFKDAFFKEESNTIFFQNEIERSRQVYPMEILERRLDRDLIKIIRDVSAFKYHLYKEQETKNV